MTSSVLFPVLIASLWLTRLALVFFPQTGYIHPDEFFQSVEVAAEDILDVEGKRSWEFNTSFPLRSATLIHATAGFPLYVLQTLDQFFSSISSATLVTAYTVLIIPRLWLTVFSFFGDFCVWHLSDKFAASPKVSLLLYASSYVVMVFYTRTLSNTTESLVFNILLLFATSDMKSSQKGNNSSRQTYTKENYTDETFGNIWYQTVMSSVFIGLLLAFGVFNRPTFVLFGMVPIILWLQHSYSLFTFVARLLYMSVGFCLTSALIVSLDTVYYKTDLVNMQVDLEYCLQRSDSLPGCIYQAAKDHFVFTPWNFFLYNTNMANLESHGAHPWYHHLTANTAVLFGPLGTTVICVFLKACFLDPKHCLNWRDGKVWPLLWIFYLPILLLSGFPHQESRFIIPLLTPVVLLAARVFKSGSTLTTLLTVTWVIFNVFGVAMFGFMHQGGVVQSLIYLQPRSAIAPTNSQIGGGQKLARSDMEVRHIVFFHTYMPPEHLLLRYRILPDDGRKNSGKMDVSVEIHDLKGGEDDELIELISTLKRQSSTNERHKVYIVAPFTRIFNNCRKFGIKWVQSFSPHLSMEDPPNMFTLITHSGWIDTSKCLPTGDSFALIYRLRNIFSLVLVQAH